MPTVLKCPSCGAPIKNIDTTKDSVECTFCQSVISIPESMRPKAHVLSSPIQISIQASRTPGVRTSSMGVVGALISVGVFLVVGWVIVSAVLPSIQNATSSITSYSITAQAMTTRSASISISQSTLAPLPSRTPTPIPIGEVVLKFGGEGTGQGKFQDGRSIAVDPAGNIFVADYTSGRVQRFNAAGEYQQTYNVPSENKGAPIRCLGVDRKGVLYICRGGNLVKINVESGQPVGTIKDPQGGFIDAVTIMPDGNIAALTSSAAKDDLILYTPQGGVLKRYNKIVSSITENSQNNLSLAVDGLGQFYILSQREKAVFLFSADGKYIDRFGGDSDNDEESLGSPFAVALDSQGRVYVSDSRRVHIFSASGKYLDRIPFEGGVPMDMEFNTGDELIMTVNIQMVYKLRLNQTIG